MDDFTYLYPTKRNLKILIDPLTIWKEAKLNSNKLIPINTIINAILYLLEETPHITIEILYPQYLWAKESNLNENSFLPIDGFHSNKKNKSLKIITKVEKFSSEYKKQRVHNMKTYLQKVKNKYVKNIDVSKLKTEKDIYKFINDKNIENDYDAKNLYDQGMDLIDIYYEYDVDIIFTTNNVLISEKEILEKSFQFFPISNFNSLEEINIFLKGHNIYYDLKTQRFVTPSLYYSITDQNMQEYIKLWAKLTKSNKNEELYQYLRTMLFNRYIFMMYSKDQFNFNIFQEKRDYNSDIKNNNILLASYHLNNFYYMFAGFIDNLAIVIDIYYSLGLWGTNRYRESSFKNKDYIKLLSNKNKVLSQNIKEIQSWLKEISLKRDPGAHRQCLFFGDIVDENHKLITDENIITMDKNGKIYYFNGIKTIEYDLNKFYEFMDKICSSLNVE